MIQLLVLKDQIRDIYRKYGRYLVPVFRFVMAWIVFTLINKQIGYEVRLLRTPIVAGLSLVSAVCPSPVMVFLAAILVLLHVFSASKIVSLVFVLIIAVLYFMFARYVPQYGWVVLAIPVLYFFHIPYVVPLLLGLMASPVSVLAVGCGVVVHYLFGLMQEVSLISTGSMEVEDTLAIYTYILKNLVSNKEMLLTIFIFALILLLTWMIRRQKFNHAYEIAVLTGTVANAVLFLVGDMVFHVPGQFLVLILGSIVSGVLAFVIQFFRFFLDYGTVENVQFDDDDYYYYVKAVPKLKVTIPEKSVKTFTSGREEWENEMADGLEEQMQEDDLEYYGSRQDYEEDKPGNR